MTLTYSDLNVNLYALVIKGRAPAAANLSKSFRINGAGHPQRDIANLTGLTALRHWHRMGDAQDRNGEELSRKKPAIQEVVSTH
jgi:hypothetical protein